MQNFTPVIVMRNMVMKLSLLLVSSLTVISVSAQPPSGMRPQGGGRGMKTEKSDSSVTRMIAEVLPQFKQLCFADVQTGRSLPYNLFVPKDYDGSKQYPLVLYMSDLSTVGDDVQRPLTQGWGGLIWATEAEQAKHPAFVLVPAYTKQAVDDNWSTSDEVEMTIRLLEQVCSDYSIDRLRLYTTGQSMGGMMSFYFNIHHPHLFAASIFVGSQWDTSKMAPFIGNKFFYIVAGGDDKASKGMSDLGKVLACQGVVPAKGQWNAKLPVTEQNDSVRTMLAKGNDINFITFTKGSVLPESGRGMEHMASFDYAYRLDAVRDWLFDQRLETYASPTEPLVIANDGDWHGEDITPLMSIKKAFDKGAYAVLFSIDKDSRTLVSTHGNCSSNASLDDAKALAKDRIRLMAYSEEELDDEDIIRLPVIDLDDSSWEQSLKTLMLQEPEFVELRYSESDEQLKDALKLTDGKIKVLANTTDGRLAGGHADIGPGGDISQSWGALKDIGVDGIITNQIKPMLRWLNDR